MRGRAGHNAGVYVLSRRASRELDVLAQREFGIPSIVLMENAARHAADIALEMLEGVERPRVLLVAGPGNNGGDALGTARHLHNAGCLARVLLSGDPNGLKGDARTNYEIARAMGVVLGHAEPLAAGATLASAAGSLEPDLLVDGVLGTGLTREVEGVLRELIEGMNELGEGGVPVLSLDLPSGLDADTGRVLGRAVRATTTVSFAGLKPGFLSLEAQAYVGDVVVADIGAPKELVARLGRELAALPGEPRAGKPRRGGRRPPPGRR